MLPRSADDCCPAGYPIPFDACRHCGATADDACKLENDSTPNEIKARVAAYLAGYADAMVE